MTEFKPTKKTKKVEHDDSTDPEDSIPESDETADPDEDWESLNLDEDETINT